MPIHMPRLAKRTQEQWLAFALKLGVVIVLFVICVFTWVHLQTSSLTEKLLHDRARAHFQTILATRQWSARHGGVYVVKEQGMQSNPYLKDPDIVDDRGRTLTLKNPSLMTREVSELALEEGLLLFHMTSLKPINPTNKPDPFENSALRGFEQQGTREAHIRELIGGRIHYRYIGALYVERSCLTCHAEQGYKVGDVRGGISVTFDIEDSESALRRGRHLLLLVAGIASFILLGVFYYLTTNLMRRVENSTEMIRRLSITDELTGLANRRHVMEILSHEALRLDRYGKPTCLIMLDIDHFKRVNDTWGHQTGDTVLRSLACILREQTRRVDIVARFGGEEFLLLLPETDLQPAAVVAEKIRAKIEAHVFTSDCGEDFRITVSQGVASLDEKGVDTAIQRADRALYCAKNAGRNRVIVADQTQ